MLYELTHLAGRHVLSFLRLTVALYLITARRRRFDTLFFVGIRGWPANQPFSGKELIARALHDLSPRREWTFVNLNCAAIPTGLLESELFGNEKCAFTGAISRKVGGVRAGRQGDAVPGRGGRHSAGATAQAAPACSSSRSSSAWAARGRSRWMCAWWLPRTVTMPMTEKMIAEGQKEALEKMLKLVPIGRHGRPEEIADAVLWLCSDRSSLVVGQAIAVDGGFTMR